MRRGIASAIIAGCSTVAATVVGMTWHSLPPQVAIPILMACAIGILIAAVVRFWPEKPKGALPGNAATTAGDGAPAMAAGRDIHYHPPAAPEASKRREWYERAKPPMEISDDALLEVEGLPLPQPDLPLNGLLVRVYQKLGGAPTDAAVLARFRGLVDREIRNEVKLKRMRVWGHVGTRPIQRISPRDWDDGEFYHMRGTFSVAHGYPEPVTTTYRDLYFNKDEVDQVWPDSPRTTK